MVLGEAVNRHTLLDLGNKKQNREYLYSFGLIDFFNLPEFSSSEESYVLAITEKYLLLSSIYQEPAEIQCTFNRDEDGSSVSLLAAFNTTHCPGSDYRYTSLGGTYLVCESFFTFNIAVGTK